MPQSEWHVHTPLSISASLHIKRRWRLVSCLFFDVSFQKNDLSDVFSLDFYPEPLNRCVWHLCSVVRGTFCLIVSHLQVPKWIHVFISWFLHLFAKMYFCVGVDVGQNCRKLKSSEKLISDLWECLLTLTWTRLLDARPFPVMFLSLFHQSCFKRLLMKKKELPVQWDDVAISDCKSSNVGVWEMPYKSLPVLFAQI